MKHVHILDHPLALELLGTLRNRETDVKSFRKASDTLTSILLIEATKHLPTNNENIHTPLSETKISVLRENIVFLPILRAGLAFVPQAISLFPGASVGMIGLKRDESTAKAHEYFSHIPDLKDAHVFLCDPMLATGGSAKHALSTLKHTGFASLRLVSVIAAPEGIDAVRKEFDIDIYTVAIDEKLNSQKYIVPGLGDFGDRYFGTP